MSESIKGTKTYFWKYLTKNKIIIPIIQRDYAQGRKEKKTIRDNFIFDLKNALDGIFKKGEKELKLDFIYGANNNNYFFPLDGQQRLTTLWLLHWYIAYLNSAITYNDSTQELNEDKKLNSVGLTLRNFTYETRESSRDFCKNLVHYAAQNQYDSKDDRTISEIIKSNIWYYTNWDNDPTIKAMLVMLDTIETSIENEKVSSYWKELTNNNCPIIFYEIQLKDFSLTDDLYIKMNARGKPLTSFENFKADLIGYIKDKSEHEIFIKSSKYKWQELLDPQSGIPNKLDTNWTDIFWENRSTNFEIDEIYFAFLNRWLLNYWIALNGMGAERIEESDIYNYLYGNHEYSDETSETDDVKISYEKFDIYKKIFDDYPIILRKLLIVLDNLSAFIKELSLKEFNSLLTSNWAPEFKFFPEYNIAENTKEYFEEEIEDFSNKRIKRVTGIGQMERPIFYAICVFFENSNYSTQEIVDISGEKKKITNWLRVCWNLTADLQLRSLGSMISCIRLFEELSTHSHKIYKYLSSYKFIDSDTSALNQQLIEECEKAKEICLHPDMETFIKKLEQTLFLNGQIRFIYRNKDGDIDWNKKIINQKLSTFKKYFNNSGLKNVIFISKYISLFDSYYQLFENFEISKRKSCWIKILLSSLYYPITHEILCIQTIDKVRANFTSLLANLPEEYKDYIILAQHELCNEKFLNVLCNEVNDNEKNHPRVHLWNDIISVYQNNTKAWYKIFVLGLNRDYLLSKLYGGEENDEETYENKKIYTYHKQDDLDRFVGWDVRFIFKYKPDDIMHYFIWDSHGNITKLKDDGTEYKSGIHYRDANNINSEKGLLKLLKDLIDN